MLWEVRIPCLEVLLEVPQPQRNPQPPEGTGPAECGRATTWRMDTGVTSGATDRATATGVAGADAMCSSWLQHPSKKLLYNTRTCSHHRGPGSAGQHCPVPFDIHSHSPVSQTQHPGFPDPQAQGQGDLRRSGMHRKPGGCRASLGKEHTLSWTASPFPH